MEWDGVLGGSLLLALLGAFAQGTSSGAGLGEETDPVLTVPPGRGPVPDAGGGSGITVETGNLFIPEGSSALQIAEILEGNWSLSGVFGCQVVGDSLWVTGINPATSCFNESRLFHFHPESGGGSTAFDMFANFRLTCGSILAALDLDSQGFAALPTGVSFHASAAGDVLRVTNTILGSCGCPTGGRRAGELRTRRPPPPPDGRGRGARDRRRDRAERPAARPLRLAVAGTRFGAAFGKPPVLERVGAGASRRWIAGHRSRPTVDRDTSRVGWTPTTHDTEAAPLAGQQKKKRKKGQKK